MSVLDFDTMKTLKLRKREQDIKNLLYLSDPVSSTALIEPDVICFGSASQFNAVPSEHLAHGSFVLHLDEPVKPLPADVTVLVFSDLREQRECYNVLAGELRSIRRIKDRVFELTALVSRGAGLKLLIDRISDIFGVPANVLDTSLSIIVRSEHFPDWITDGNNGEGAFLPERAQAAMKAEGLVSHLAPEKAKVFTWYDDEGNLCYNHYAAISIGDTAIGSVSLFTQNAPMRKSRVDLLPIIAQILSIEMQKSSTYLMNKSVYYSHLFTDLINGSIDEKPEAIRYRFSVFGYSLRTYKRLVYADLSGEYLEPSQVQALAERLHKVLDNNVYVVTNQGIILLTSRDRFIDDGIYRASCLEGNLLARGFEQAPPPPNEDSASNEEESDVTPPDRLDLCDLADVVRGTDVKIGISSVFTNILHLPSYMVQAQRAIATGRHYDPTGPLYFFASYRMADLLSHVEDQKALYALRYPPLMHVIREDMRHGTNLAYTLFVYLQDPSHPLEVCEKLFIHKNTLYYRLDRIRQLMGVDIKSGWVITQVEMTFLILKHQGRFDELVLPQGGGERAETGAAGKNAPEETRKRGRKTKTKTEASEKDARRSHVHKIVEPNVAAAGSTRKRGASDAGSETTANARSMDDASATADGAGEVGDGTGNGAGAGIHAKASTKKSASEDRNAADVEGYRA